MPVGPSMLTLVVKLADSFVTGRLALGTAILSALYALIVDLWVEQPGLAAQVAVSPATLASCKRVVPLLAGPA